MKLEIIKLKMHCLLITLIYFSFVNSAYSQTGNIDETDKWAWGSNLGWVDFCPTNGGVTVYDDHLEGYAYAENIGWVRLGTHTTGSPHTYTNTNSTNYGVNHDGSGNLSGYAWSTNAGWINFNPNHSQVTINMGTGSFDGYAWSENVGWIHFKNVSPEYNVICTNPALPVELLSFEAESDDTEVVLRWETATEVDNYGFEIERASTQGSTVIPVSSNDEDRNLINWQSIGFVDGAGNSNSPLEYSFVDTPTGGSQFQYRLKQIDTDGQFTYTDIVEVEVVPERFELYQNYPNPFNPSTTIKYQIPVSRQTTAETGMTGQIKLVIYDLLGQKVTTLVNEPQGPGNYEVIWDAIQVSSGMYIYRLVAGEFVGTKKMILLR